MLVELHGRRFEPGRVHHLWARSSVVEHLISRTLVVTTTSNTEGGALLARAREPGKEVIATGGLTSGCGSKLVEGSLQLHRNSQRGPSREAHFKPRLGHG
jgi:hypothetical protein